MNVQWFSMALTFSLRSACLTIHAAHTQDSNIFEHVHVRTRASLFHLGLMQHGLSPGTEVSARGSG